MTTGRWERTDQRLATGVLDVVAGLVAGPSASRVARAAVREAAGRGARVRFVQVIPAGAADAEVDAAGSSTFAAALKALRDAGRVPVSFEIAVGDAGPVLTQRSRGAGLLVVGGGEAGATSDLAAYCLEHAECDVLQARAAAVQA